MQQTPGERGIALLADLRLSNFSAMVPEIKGGLDVLRMGWLCVMSWPLKRIKDKATSDEPSMPYVN